MTYSNVDSHQETCAWYMQGSSNFLGICFSCYQFMKAMVWHSKIQPVLFLYLSTQIIKICLRSHLHNKFCPLGLNLETKAYETVPCRWRRYVAQVEINEGCLLSESVYWEETAWRVRQTAKGLWGLGANGGGTFRGFGLLYWETNIFEDVGEGSSESIDDQEGCLSEALCTKCVVTLYIFPGRLSWRCRCRCSTISCSMLHW